VGDGKDAGVSDHRLSRRVHWTSIARCASTKHPDALKEFVNLRYSAIKSFNDEGTQMPRKQTFQEWLEIHKDLDAYIARGGKLRELNLLDEVSHKRLEYVIAAELGEETLARLSRFFKSIMDTMNRKRPVGEVLTESKLQELWRKTASYNKQ
jgi:hypothetical protein